LYFLFRFELQDYGFLTVSYLGNYKVGPVDTDAFTFIEDFDIYLFEIFDFAFSEFYGKSGLAQHARTLMALSLPFGHTVRYAVKANPHPEIIRLFDEHGLYFDASSSYEADLLLKLGVAGDKITDSDDVDGSSQIAKNNLTPGQFARIRVPGSEPYQAILIPDSALVTDQSRKQVLVVKDDGTVEARVVRPGPSYDGLRIIRKGLAASDRIIINGLMRARPGAKVTPQPGTIEPEPSS